MDFSYLTAVHTGWRRVLPIGRTIRRPDGNVHIVGMTLGEQAQLHILEPCRDAVMPRRRKNATHRSIAKEPERDQTSCLHCKAVRIGERTLEIQGGQAGPLGYRETPDFHTVRLFFAMLDAGWQVPDWLREMDWNELQLVSLRLDGVKRLPKYTPEMPVTLVYGENFIRHIVEKTVALEAGRPRSFTFTDHAGERVRCYIDSVTLMDPWAEAERRFDDPRLKKLATPEQLEEAKKGLYEALEQNVPRGTRYVGIEYECEKDYGLQFYTKEYLSSRPEARQGSSSGLVMMLKPDKPTGPHGLPLRGCALQTPVPPDTVRLPAELFCYHEKTPAWEESAE